MTSLTRRFAVNFVFYMRRAFLLFALLLAPALQAGTVLRGGAFATVERPAALPANAEEWEAFLSFDGGQYYAVRITPHLDVARGTFTWIVPNVDTANARILIRAGDERRETLYELPERFAIVRDAGAPMPRHVIVPAASGEAARDGDPGVVAWTDGDRSGGALVERWAHCDRSRVAAACPHERGVTSLAVAPAVHVRRPVVAAVHAVASPIERAFSLARRTDILLTVSRLNI
jgi:hypothetical protein